MDAKKPELTLLPGDAVFDVDAIVAFYTKLTGKTPTPKEVEELRVELSKARDVDREQSECAVTPRHSTASRRE